MKGLDNEIRPNHPTKLLRATNILAFILLVALNVVTQTSIVGRSDLEISARFPTPLTPASWAFTIWGAILGLQAVGVVYQALPHGYTADGMKQRYVNGIGYGWQLGWCGEMAWQLLFQLESPLGMVLCVVCLAVAFAALGRTLFNMYRLKEAHGSLSSILLYVAFFLPTSINTAWLSCAAAVAALMVPEALHHTAHLEALAVVLLVIVTLLGAPPDLRALNIRQLRRSALQNAPLKCSSARLTGLATEESAHSRSIWTWISGRERGDSISSWPRALAPAAGVAIVQRHRDSAYGLTLVWALVAIYGEQRSAVIRVVTLACICANTLAAIFSMLRRRTPGAQTELSDVRQPLSRINTV